MKPEIAEALRRLLAEARVLSLAVLVDGKPCLGLLPFAADPVAGALLVHASQLARHSRGMSPDAPYSALVHAPDEPGADPLQIARLTVDGTVAPIEKGSADHEPARELYARRFPSSRPLFALGDFHLYRLTITHGRLVTGFAQAYNLDPSAFRALGG